MKKVIIIGCPGSGKSTFGRRLREISGLPLYHLDMMYWNADKTTVPREVFMARLENAMKEPRWIIDGNYESSMKMRLEQCDTVFFLDFDTDICLSGIEARKGKQRSDMPWTETDDTDDVFLEFVEKYNTRNRPAVYELLRSFSSKNIIIFRTREESEVYLQTCGR